MFGNYIAPARSAGAERAPRRDFPSENHALGPFCMKKIPISAWDTGIESS